MKNSKNISKHIIFGIIMMIFIVPFLVQAQTGPAPAPTEGPAPSPVKIDIKIENPFKQNTIEGLIKTIINDILIPIGGVIAVLMIMYAGFMYVTARGEPAKITKAKDALIYAVIGAAILLGAWVISQAIQGTISQLKSS